MESLPEGATAWALDRIKSDKRISGVIERLLENVLIVPNLATALRLRPSHPGVTFVTLAGVMLTGEGMLRGGASKEGTTSVLELQQRGPRARGRGRSADRRPTRPPATASTELEARLERLREEVEVSRERLQRQKVELSTLQGQLSLATREVENFETKVENVRWERGELDNRERAAAEGREHMEGELASARERLEALESESRRLQSESDAAVRREQDLNAALNELRTDLAVERRAKQSAEEQQKPMEARLSELREISIRRETEIESFTQRIEAAIAENARLAEECETHRLEVEDLQVEINTRAAGRADLLEAIETAETELAAVRRDHAKVAEQKGREEVAATKLDLRLESLTTAIQERHQIDLATFEPDAHALLASIASQKALQARGGRQSIVSPARIRTEAPRTRTKCPTMVVDGTNDDDMEIPGEIDRRAGLGIRRDPSSPTSSAASTRWARSISTPSRSSRNSRNDITSSRTSTTTSFPRKPSCWKSSSASTPRPSASSPKPSPRSRSTSRRCSRNSSARRARPTSRCIDEEDPLESGIEVIAKPPGKKLQSITLLSGGERSMTAVALLFSIYMIKPSPFCVLDELDAPLDESNINRFVKVLDRFIDRSQFIIVTHSKRTMARADVMYGVTMEEFGVSKPVGMRLTASDDSKTGAEPKSAAQRAALRLDS